MFKNWFTNKQVDLVEEETPLTELELVCLDVITKGKLTRLGSFAASFEHQGFTLQAEECWPIKVRCQDGSERVAFGVALHAEGKGVYFSKHFGLAHDAISRSIHAAIAGVDAGAQLVELYQKRINSKP